MDLYQIIFELVQERNRVQKIIESLENMDPEADLPSRAAVKRRGRKSMDRAARDEVSARMKRYWEKRRSERRGKSGDGDDNGNGAMA